MEKDYSKFLSAKIYLIEHLSLKGKLAGDKTLTEIHNICLADLSKIQQKLDELSNKSTK